MSDPKDPTLSQAFLATVEINVRLTLPRLWQSIGWLLVVTVIVLTLMPKPPQPPFFLLNWDKAQHLLAYAGLMCWFRQAFARRLRWIGLFIGLGVALEYIQGWMGFRQFDYDDMLANGLGVLAGLLLAATPLGRLVPWLDRRLEPIRKVLSPFVGEG